MTQTAKSNLYACIRSSTGTEQLEAIQAVCTVDSETGCWHREAILGGKSQPRIMIDGKHLYLSVVAFTAKHGDIPDNIVLRQTCGTPHCLNPDHNALTLSGTSRKGKKGKLTQEQAQAIVNDMRSHREIAEDFGISTSYISRIKSGAAWENLTRTAQGVRKVRPKKARGGIQKARPRKARGVSQDIRDWADMMVHGTERNGVWS